MPKLIKKEEPNILYSSDNSHKKKSKASFDEVIPEKTLLELKKERKGKGGKFVIIIDNLPDNSPYFKTLLKKMKNHFACGGSLKSGKMIIQTEKRDQVKSFLEEMGFKTKCVGS